MLLHPSAGADARFGSAAQRDITDDGITDADAMASAAGQPDTDPARQRDADAAGAGDAEEAAEADTLLLPDAVQAPQQNLQDTVQSTQGQDTLEDSVSNAAENSEAVEAAAHESDGAGLDDTSAAGVDALSTSDALHSSFGSGDALTVPRHALSTAVRKHLHQQTSLALMRNSAVRRSIVA